LAAIKADADCELDAMTAIPPVTSALIIANIFFIIFDYSKIHIRF